LRPRLVRLLHRLSQDEDPVVQARAQWSLHRQEK